MTYKLDELMEKKRKDLEEIARGLEIEDPEDFKNKTELAEAIIDAEAAGGAETPQESEKEEETQEEVKEKPKPTKGKGAAAAGDKKPKVREKDFVDDDQLKINNLKTFYDAFTEYPASNLLDPLMSPLCGRVRQLCNKRGLRYSRDMLNIFIETWAPVLIIK